MTACTLSEVIVDALQSPTFAMQAETARILAEQILRAAADLGHSGVDYYLPGMQHLSREERNARIRREFNGRNLREICRKYGVKRMTVYRACRRAD